MERIIECVPNFSEGRNMEVINSIVATIEKAGGVKILDVDPRSEEHTSELQSR